MFEVLWPMGNKELQLLRGRLILEQHERTYFGALRACIYVCEFLCF